MVAMAAKGVAVKYSYIVGNHDWLINRYPETRTKIANSLNLDNIGHYKTNHFSTEYFWEDYKAFARHSDIYDLSTLKVIEMLPL